MVLIRYRNRIQLIAMSWFYDFSVYYTNMSIVYVLNLIVLYYFITATHYTYFITFTLMVSVYYIIHNYFPIYLHVYLFYVCTRLVLKTNVIPDSHTCYTIPQIHSLTPNYPFNYNIYIHIINVCVLKILHILYETLSKCNTFRQIVALLDGTSFLSITIYNG